MVKIYAYLCRLPFFLCAMNMPHFSSFNSLSHFLPRFIRFLSANARHCLINIYCATTIELHSYSFFFRSNPSIASLLHFWCSVRFGKCLVYNFFFPRQFTNRNFFPFLSHSFLFLITATNSK